MVTSAAITAAPSTLVSLTALTGRALNTCRRTPSLAAGPVVMSAFFLVIYDGQLAAAAGAIVPGGSYVAFLLPVVLLTTAFTGGAISGQLLLRDLDSRYYACLALTPARRSFLVAAPTLAGTAVITLQAFALVPLAWALGLRPPNGIVGISVVVAHTVVAGAGFLLLAVAAALVGRTAAAVNTVTYVFFPLSFLTTTFVPRDHLQGWIGLAADLNPLTYLLEGMRDALNPGWSWSSLLGGSLAAVVILAMGLMATSWGLRRHNAEDVDR